MMLRMKIVKKLNRKDAKGAKKDKSKKNDLLFKT